MVRRRHQIDGMFVYVAYFGVFVMTDVCLPLCRRE